MSAYYRLHCITRKRHGLPPQPFKFFDAIYHNVISQGSGEIALGKSDNQWVSGAVYFFCGPEVPYKYGVSDKNVQNMRANDLLMWEAIKRYAQKGCKILSFGKTERYHVGLSRFKEGFGAQRIDLYDHIYDVCRGQKIVQSPSIHGLHNCFFRKMPLPLLRLSGKMLYKYSV